MNLASAYAALIREVPEKDAKDFAARLVAFMKHRGHLSLLPQILGMLEREPAGGADAIVTVAKLSDAEKFGRRIREALAALGAGAHRVHVDPRAVGGYAVRAGSKLVDRSFRTALVSLYRDTVS